MLMLSCSLMNNSVLNDGDALTPTRASMSRISSQAPVEEIRRGVISAQPVGVAQEIVHLVGKDQLLELDVALAQPAHQLDGLIEGDVAVVVAVDQQHGRFPFLHRRDGRRLASE